MRTKNQQSLKHYLDSVQNIENAMVDPSSFKTIMQQINKAQTNDSGSWFTIPKYKFVAASVAFVIFVNLLAIIKVSSEQRGPDSANITSKILMDDYNISR
jgi:hypothetical protein